MRDRRRARPRPGRVAVNVREVRLRSHCPVVNDGVPDANVWGGKVERGGRRPPLKARRASRASGRQQSVNALPIRRSSGPASVRVMVSPLESSAAAGPPGESPAPSPSRRPARRRPVVAPPPSAEQALVARVNEVLWARAGARQPGGSFPGFAAESTRSDASWARFMIAGCSSHHSSARAPVSPRCAASPPIRRRRRSRSTSSRRPTRSAGWSSATAGPPCRRGRRSWSRRSRAWLTAGRAPPGRGVSRRRPGRPDPLLGDARDVAVCAPSPRAVEHVAHGAGGEVGELRVQDVHVDRDHVEVVVRPVDTLPEHRPHER